MSARRVSVDVVATQQAIENTRRAARSLDEVLDELPRLLDPLRTAAVPGLGDIVEHLARPISSWKKAMEGDAQAAIETARSVEKQLERLVNVDTTWASVFGCGGGGVQVITVNPQVITQFVSGTQQRFDGVIMQLRRLVACVNDLQYGGPRANSFRDESSEATQNLVTSVLGALRDQSRLITRATREVYTAARTPRLSIDVPIANGDLFVGATAQLATSVRKAVIEDTAWIKSGQLEEFGRLLDAVATEIVQLLNDHQMALLNLDWAGRSRNAAVGFVQRSNAGVLNTLKDTTTEIKAMISEQIEDVRLADGSPATQVRINKSSMRHFIRRTSTEIEAIALLVSNLSPSIELARYKGPNADKFRRMYEGPFEEFSMEFLRILLEISEQANLSASEVGVSLGLSRSRPKTDRVSLQSMIRGERRLVMSHRVLEIDIAEMGRLRARIDRSRLRVIRRLHALRISLENVDWSGAARNRSVERWTNVISKSEQRIEMATQQLCVFIDDQIRSSQDADRFELS